MKRGSAGLPVALASSTALLAIALLVGWTLLSVGAPGQTWLLVLGVISFSLILGVLGVLVLTLVRELRLVRQQDQFIDSITHELRTPLASLRLAIETLERPELDLQQRASLERMMWGDVVRLSTLIDDVLAASRIAAGRHGHALGEVAVHDVASRAATTVMERHQLAPGALVLDVPSGLTARTDAAALELCLRNLLDNAIKYSDASARGARLSAEVDRTRKRVRLTVSDKGIGMTKGELRSAFRRFERGEREAVRSRAGTGLGLYVVAETVRGLGGKVAARSEGEGRGSQFELTLPMERKR